MARQASSFVENNFVKGLVTEATGLNFPEQAVTEASNCVFDEKGLVRRRLGVNFEYGFANISISRTSKAVSCFTWEAAAGDGNNVIVVTQIGSTLYFYLASGEAVSDNLFASVSLTAFLPDGSTEDPSTVECQFSSGKGFLFVASPVLESIYVSYDPDMLSVTASEIPLMVRDFEGVDDDLELDQHPSTLSSLHHYNLFNQGWDLEIQLNVPGGGTNFPIEEWFVQFGHYPSNADVWWYYLDSVSQFAPDAVNFRPGNSPAPKGHYIVNYYNQDRSTASGIADMPSTSSGNNRASTISFFAGRVWYSGVTGTGYSNRILFSQIIERDSQIGSCYQTNDPTSQDVFDLLPSDGGTILIPDSGTILKLLPYQDSLLVFGTNGVWRISGSQGVGFTANDYSIVQMSSISLLTAASFVSVAGVPTFWSAEGIYTVTTSQTSGSPEVQSLTDTTIKDAYDDIPYESKKYARGVYNRNDRVITWVYRSTEPTTLTQKYSFDSVLNLNTLSGAFYLWSFDTSDVEIIGVVVCLASRNEGGSTSIVTNSALATVTDSLGATVYSLHTPDTSTTADVTKFFVAHGSYVTFADEWDTNYVDWLSYDAIGTSFSSSFTTGYKVHGDGQRKAQPTYINLFFDTRDVNSSIDFRSLWQYATSGSTGRWSTAQRVTTDSTDYAYTRKRLKSRGSGVAYQFNVTSVTGQPFNLIGWSVFETANSGP